MTLEYFAQRVGAVLAICSAPVFVVAVICASTGDSGDRQVQSLHHLFGLTFAVIGALLLTVGGAMSSIAEKSAARSATSAQGPELG